MGDVSWFITTPEAVLRAESVLVAFQENRLEDIGTTLAQDYDLDTPSPLHTLVALICMADRLASFSADQTDFTVRDLIRESARVVAHAAYGTDPEGDTHD